MFVHLPVVPPPSAHAVTLPGGNRFYETPSGHRYPSVTTVLKIHSRDGIEAWRRRVGKEEAARVGARAGARGTRIHTLVEQYLNNEPVQPKLMDLEMFVSMKKHLNRINNICLQEAALYSDYLRLAGRCDCVAEFDGTLSIIDFKSSLRKKIADHIHGYCMQVSGYAKISIHGMMVSTD
jgi:genome maintenance exonuclease 1